MSASIDVPLPPGHADGRCVPDALVPRSVDEVGFLPMT